MSDNINSESGTSLSGEVNKKKITHNPMTGFMIDDDQSSDAIKREEDQQYPPKAPRVEKIRYRI